MTTRFAGLMGALDRLEHEMRRWEPPGDAIVADILKACDAARTVALPILEGEQKLRDRLAVAIWQADSTSHAVDAVLTTLTEESE